MDKEGTPGGRRASSKRGNMWSWVLRGQVAGGRQRGQMGWNVGLLLEAVESQGGTSGRGMTS